jgi:hypothetical protein
VERAQETIPRPLELTSDRAEREMGVHTHPLPTPGSTAILGVWVPLCEVRETESSWIVNC